MIKHLKYGVSAAALALVLTNPAAAFDEVDWTWTNDIVQHVDIDIDINAAHTFYPTGITQVEQLQVSAGNISAASNQNFTSFNAGTENSGGWHDNSPSRHGNGNNSVPGLNAVTELGRLEGNATAAANLTSIQSDVGTYAHDTQIAFGGFDKIDNFEDVLQAAGAGLVSSLIVPTGNQGTDALATAAIAAQFGLITKGNVDAYAEAKHVTNAQVALNATAAGNLHSITVGPEAYEELDTLKPTSSPSHGSPGGNGSNSPTFVTNSILIADLNQFSLMNVSATADAHGLEVNGYTNLGSLKDQYGTYPAAVSSVSASAFGNMSSVTNRVNGLAPLAYVK